MYQNDGIINHDAAQISKKGRFKKYYPVAYVGAHGGAVGCGTFVQPGRSRVRFPIMSLDLSGRSMAPDFNHPLTEMSTTNISWGVKAVGA